MANRQILSWLLVWVTCSHACNPGSCPSNGAALMQRDFQQRGSFHPDAVSLQGRLSENASIIDSSDLRALEEANEQLYVLLPMSKQIPSMIVYVATENDVLEALRYCRTHQLRPVLVATGHDWNGRSSGAGAVRIATPKLCWVHVEGDQAHVGAGCTWGHVNQVLEPMGHIAVAGAFPTVSISGSLQGGGHGGLSRQHGLMVDQLLAARVALANGSGVVVANADGPHADLFRALRGGGGGTYGAVVEFTVRIHPFPKSYTRSFVTLPLPQAREVTTRFFHNASWWAAVPDSWAGWHEVNSEQDGDQWSAYFASWLYHWGQDPREACLSSGCPAALSEYFEFLDQWPVQVDIHKEMQSYVRKPINASTLRKSFQSNSFVSLADLQDEEKARRLTDLVMNSTLQALERKEVIAWTYNDVLGGQIPKHGQDTAISSGFRNAIFEICLGKTWNHEDNEQQLGAAG